MQLFIDKLKFCERVYDFTNARAQILQKEAKRRQLVDLTEYMSSNKNAINEHTAVPFMNMVTANLIRALPVNGPSDPIVEAEDDEHFHEPSWPHLQLVYDMMRQFIIGSNMDTPAVRESITMPFVHGIIDLFNTEDPREREYLKTILHRIYGRAMNLRDGIRQSIIDVFHGVVYENEQYHGMCELLEILGSIIHGFAVPLRDEYKELLRNGILPLHLPDTMPSYHVQLSFCVGQFVEKEPELGCEIVTTLLKHWPYRNTRKEVLLLAELEEVLELTGEDESEGVIIPLFRRLGRSIGSPHFQVSERALFYWTNDLVLDVFDRYRDRLMPTIYGPLFRNASSHWNRNVLLLSENVLESLKAMDPQLYHSCEKSYQVEIDNKVREEKERLVRWRLLDRMAKLRGKGKAIKLGRDDVATGNGVVSSPEGSSYTDDDSCAEIGSDDCLKKIDLNCGKNGRVKEIVELIDDRLDDRGTF